jgi:hypothetical protein
MAQPYIPGWIRLAAHIDHEGSSMLLIQDYKTPETNVTGAMLNALCQDWWTTHSPSLVALLTQGYIVRFVEATDRSHAGGATGAYTVSSGGQGTRANDAMPASVANVISWRTGRAGRANRGRTYMFGMADTDAIGSYFISSYLTGLGLFALALLVYDGPPTLFVTKAVASVSQLEMVVATTYIINDVVDSQRKRLPGRGS